MKGMERNEKSYWFNKEKEEREKVNEQMNSGMLGKREKGVVNGKEGGA